MPRRQILERALGNERARRWWVLAAGNGDSTAIDLLDRLDGTQSPANDYADSTPTVSRPSATHPVAKRAGDPAYRDQLLAARYDPHIAPFNQYVDRLMEERGKWLPYLAPTYGGVHARLLSLFQDPGPKTKTGIGTGMLCVENPDDSAARYLGLLTSAGIRVADTVSWNSYPWYLGRPPTDEEISEALPVLATIIELMPRLEVVLLHGVTAQKAWAKLSRFRPDITVGLHAVETYHTSPRVIERKSPEERARRERKLSDDFACVKGLLKDS